MRRRANDARTQPPAGSRHVRCAACLLPRNQSRMRRGAHGSLHERWWMQFRPTE
ncbi:hypothetical protein CLF39_27185 [Salmonella enterica subsp. enterica serovar Kottbus]|nr:hypothetical protein [Salmonella enterica subsp. enterica serovar Kottbus]